MLDYFKNGSAPSMTDKTRKKKSVSGKNNRAAVAHPTIT
jgi:hypothetical protein